MTDSCPQQSDLRDYLLGKLASKKSAIIDRHVAGCTNCEDTLQGIESNTDLGFGLVAPTSGKRLLEQIDAPNSLMGRLEKLGHASSATPTGKSASEQIRPEESLVGTFLRQYELLELIGRGGMGAVYRARHTNLDRVVAVKVLPSDQLRNRESVARFRREMKAVGRLNHPNIVKATDADEVDGVHFLAMDLIDGPNLSQLVEQTGPLSVADACELMRQTAAALQEAHSNGLVHRDIKPSNLLLDADGQIRVLDLGLALLHEESGEANAASDVTSTGQIMGTADYMAPEQAMDTHDVDIRADIYSLGCTLFFLLTGKPPYRKDGDSSPLKTLMRHANDPVPDIRKMRNDVPQALASLIERMLAKAPTDRPLALSKVAKLLTPFSRDSDTARLRNTWSSRSATSSPKRRSASASLAPLRDHDSVAPLPIVRTARRVLNRRTWILVVAVPAILLLTIVIHIATDNGEIVIEVADDIQEQVTVNVMRDGGPLIEGWEVSSKDNSRTVRTGPVEVQLPEAWADEFEVVLQGDRAIVSRHGQLIVNIRRKIEGDGDSESVEAHYALEFDGVDDHVEVDTSNLPIRQNFKLTVELWAHVHHSDDKFMSVLRFAHEPVIGLEIRPHPEVWGANWSLMDGAEIANPLVRNRVFYSEDPLRKHWTHVAAVFDYKHPHCRPVIYVNGKKNGRESINTNPGNHDWVKSKTLRVGGYNTRYGYFHGQIRGIRVSSGLRYHTDFTPPERFSVDAETLLLYNFDEGKGDQLVDSSGNGFHGKIEGAKWVRIEPVRTGEASIAEPEPHADSDWVELFNGRDLEGWRYAPNKSQTQRSSMSETWTVDAERRVIVSREGDHNCIETDAQFEDFELELEWRFPDALRIEPNASGIVVRSNGVTTRGKLAGFDPTGIEIDIRSPAEVDWGPHGTGCLLAYEMAAANATGTVSGLPPSRNLGRLRTPALKPVGNWNTTRIRCVDGDLFVWMNGDLINEASITGKKSGRICLRSQDTNIEFRSLHIRHLNEQGHAEWDTLFNEKNLSGWEQIGDLGWTVKNGILSVPPDGVGWLGSTREFTDFELRLEYRISKPGANSGVFLRAIRSNDHPHPFPEIQILHDDHPEYQTVPRTQHTSCFQSVAATSKRVSSVINTWHSMRILCVGPTVKVWFDDEHVLDATIPIDKLRESGHIGLQTYNTGGVDFRKIQVRKVNAPKY